MCAAAILFSRQDWIVPGLGVLGLALLFLIWTYRRAPVHRGPRLIGAVLKLIGLAALLACLLEPLSSGQRVKPGSNEFIILADNSQSLGVHDPGQTQSRGDALRALLHPDPSAWQSRLARDFQLRRYFFDTRLKSTADFAELAFDGRATSLGAALRTVVQLHQGRPVAGVLLFTDGNATDLRGAAPALPGLPPVYPVVMGSDQPIHDLAINSVAVSQTAFEDAPVSIQASVSAHGYANEKISAQVFDRMGTLVDQQTQKAPPDDTAMAFNFRLRPTHSGLSFYRVQVSAKGESGSTNQLPAAAEATLANNSRLVAVDRGQGPYRVLYVSGRPNWEFKFMNRALAEDSQVQLVGLIRVANREPKFVFRGRQGESSNPLFRGFDRQDDTTERYDQPVLVRLNLRDETELQGGFPKTAEDLYGYQAIILDDLEAGFFTADQQTLVQQFVASRGGGLLMMGGPDSFQEGQYYHTPIGDLLPVYLDRSPDAQVPEHFQLALSREGWLQPWARLRDNEADERARLETMPPFEVLNRVRAIKPGASVIASVTDSSGKEYPALATQRYGHGRSAALLLGDYWRWGLRSPEMHRDLDKAWRQMTRWLVADVPQRLELQVEQNQDDAETAVRLQLRVRDPKFLPVDDALASLQVQRIREGGPSTNTVRLNAEPSSTEPGLYTAVYVPHETGAYQVEATVTNAVGAEIGRVRAGWTTDLAGDEFRALKPNRSLLEMIAKQTGGEVVSPAALDSLARNLPFRPAPVTEAWSTPLWHRPAVFLLVLACFLAEWGLRRWKGLP